VNFGLARPFLLALEKSGIEFITENDGGRALG